MATSQVRLGSWFRHELPRLNRAVLYEAAPVATVADGLAVVLPDLPSPAALDPLEAQRLVIDLGLAGSSVARHFQEHDTRRKEVPEASFEGLDVGPDAMPFREYFAALAARTGTGHYPRDAYASLVLWNVPTTEVRFLGETLAALPGVHADSHIHSYTGDPGEQWFFELVKRGQTIELAANKLLEPMVDGDIGLASEEGLRRVRLATTLLEALRLLFVEFAAAAPPTAAEPGAGGAYPDTGDPAPATLGMRPQYFMDVFRQFAVHWTVGDIPPSGALDVDAVKRDFLLGTVDELYLQHVARITPALLTHESASLGRLMSGPSLPARLLTVLGIDQVDLAQLSAGQLGDLAGAHPALADWYLLLSAHARAAGGHLMLSKRFLFNPQRHRDEVGIGDRTLVSNRRGTTGMDEPILDRLTRMRREHPFAGLRHTPVAALRTGVPYPVEGVEIVSSSGLFTGGLAPPPRDAAALDPTPDGSPPAGHARRRRGPGTSGPANLGRPVIDE